MKVHSRKFIDLFPEIQLSHIFLGSQVITNSISMATLKECSFCSWRKRLLGSFLLFSQSPTPISSGFFYVSKNICNKDLFVRLVTAFLYTYLKLLSLQPQCLHVNTVATRTVGAKIKHALCDRTGFVYGSYILSPSCVLGVSGSRIEFFKKSLRTSVGLRVHRRWCRSRRGSKNMQPQMQWGNCGFAPFFCHRIDTRWGNVDQSVYFVWTRH